MKHIFKTLTLIAILTMAVSCKWTSTTETKSLQHQVNKSLYGYTTEEILDELGQPTSVTKDTLDGIPVTVLRFEDKVMLQHYAHYAEAYQMEDPFIVIFLKNGKAYSTKTNMVDTVISKNEKTISIVKLSTYAGVLLLAIILTFIALMLTRRAKLNKLEEEMNFLHNRSKETKKSIEDLYTKYKWLNGAKSEMYDSIRDLTKSIKRMQLREDAFNKHIDNIYETIHKQPTETEELRSKSTPFYQMDENERKILLSKRLNETEISIRALNCLRAAEIYTIGDLCSKSRYEIKKYRNFRRKSLTEIDILLERRGLSYGMDLTAYGYEKHKTPFDNENQTSEENSEGNLQEPERTGEAAGQEPAEDSVQQQSDQTGLQPSETPQD